MLLYISYLAFNSQFFHYLKLFKQIIYIIQIIHAYAMTNNKAKYFTFKVYKQKINKSLTK